MDGPDLTVLMVVHNEAESLPTVLGHFEVQHYPSARFEVLVVDDAGTDDTGEVLDRHAAGAPVRIRHCRQEERSPGRALEKGLQLAAGRYVVYLAPGLLASAALLEEHLRLQEQHAGRTVTVGPVERHPQAPGGTLLRHFVSHSAAEAGDAPPNPSKLDNFCVSRQLLNEHGGFRDDFDSLHAALQDLGGRLCSRAMPWHRVPAATAYAWQPTEFALERRRAYARHYRFRRVVEQNRSQALRNDPVAYSRVLREAAASPALPVAALLCGRVRTDSRLFDRLSAFVFEYEARRGYRDAVEGRVPRFALPDD